MVCVSEPMPNFLAARIKALRSEADTLERVLEDYWAQQGGKPAVDDRRITPTPPSADPAGVGRVAALLDKIDPHWRDVQPFRVPDKEEGVGGRPIARGSRTYKTLEWLHVATVHGLTVEQLYDLHSASGYENQSGVRNVLHRQTDAGRIVKRGDLYYAALYKDIV